MGKEILEILGNSNHCPFIHIQLTLGLRFTFSLVFLRMISSEKEILNSSEIYGKVFDPML